jgi:hypothetical protein
MAGPLVLARDTDGVETAIRNMKEHGVRRLPSSTRRRACRHPDDG